MKIEIKGKQKLFGEVFISGSKNSSLPIIASSIISRRVVKIGNVPKIQDILDMLEILEELNVSYSFEGSTLTIDSTNVKYADLTSEKVSKIRASYYLMSSCLVLFKKVLMAKTGGCKIGERPIDLHLNAFKQMGCIVEEGEQLNIFYDELNDAVIKFEKKSVGATINALILSLNCNKLIIKNAAVEPEILDFIDFLSKLGRKIVVRKNTIISMKKETSTNRIIEHTVIPDRIEAATFMVIGALCGGIKVCNVNVKHLKNVIYPLKKLKVGLKIKSNSIYVYKRKIVKYDIFVKEYPGFSTDIQPLFCPLLCLGKKSSIVVDYIFKERFKVCEELNKMGGKIKTEKHGVLIKPVKCLIGNTVCASDLRCAAGLIIAGLISEGTTVIENADYINRGYENIVSKLSHLGADIKIC